jgi:hypothetical protein
MSHQHYRRNVYSQAHYLVIICVQQASPDSRHNNAYTQTHTRCMEGSRTLHTAKNVSLSITPLPPLPAGQKYALPRSTPGSGRHCSKQCHYCTYTERACLCQAPRTCTPCNIRQQTRARARSVTGCGCAHAKLCHGETGAAQTSLARYLISITSTACA